MKAAGCGCGEEKGPIYLHSRCHPRYPTWTSLEGRVVTVRCAFPDCDKLIWQGDLSLEEAES